MIPLAASYDTRGLLKTTSNPGLLRVCHYDISHAVVIYEEHLSFPLHMACHACMNVW